MLRHSHPGLFIAFEGLDGSGSSTQVDLLSKGLNKAGVYSYTSKEPTNNLIGGLIRGALTKDWKASPECLQLLFAADRAHHLEREIIPNLEKGNVIVTDRYFFSTIAFGGINLDKKWLEKLNERFIVPDITFFIKVSPKECIRRIGKSRNQFELFEEEEKLKKVRSIYLTMARRKEFNMIIVDGERGVEQIAAEIFLIVKPILMKKMGLHYRSENLFSLKETK